MQSLTKQRRFICSSFCLIKMTALYYFCWFWVGCKFWVFWDPYQCYKFSSNVTQPRLLCIGGTFIYCPTEYNVNLYIQKHLSSFERYSRHQKREQGVSFESPTRIHSLLSSAPGCCIPTSFLAFSLMCTQLWYLTYRFLLHRFTRL